MATALPCRKSDIGPLLDVRPRDVEMVPPPARRNS
jgi:hypothetical protein